MDVDFTMGLPLNVATDVDFKQSTSGAVEETPDSDYM